LDPWYIALISMGYHASAPLTGYVNGTDCDEPEFDRSHGLFIGLPLDIGRSIQLSPMLRARFEPGGEACWEKELEIDEGDSSAFALDLGVAVRWFFLHQQSDVRPYASLGAVRIFHWVRRSTKCVSCGTSTQVLEVQRAMSAAELAVGLRKDWVQPSLWQGSVSPDLASFYLELGWQQVFGGRTDLRVYEERATAPRSPTYVAPPNLILGSVTVTAGFAYMM